MVKGSFFMKVRIFAMMLIVALVTGFGFWTRGAQATETCPDGGAWQKDETAQGGYDETCHGGKKVTQICIKGGTKVAYYSTNGNDGCWARSGIGTSEGSAWKIGSGPTCKDISHASFKCETVTPISTPTPAPTVTPVPTPTVTVKPSPTLICTPTAAPEPTPTAVPEPTPTEKPEPTPTEAPEPTPTDEPEPTPTDEPEPTPTDEPEVTEAPEPTQEPEETPEPTESPEPTDEPEPTEEPGRGGVEADNKDMDLEVNGPNCDYRFTAKATLKDGDKPLKDITVGFKYLDQAVQGVTNNEGSATANFTYIKDGELMVEASGFDTERRGIKGPEDCEGEVLGASTDTKPGGKVLGYASTTSGLDILGLYTAGLILLTGGGLSYARAKKPVKK